MCSLFANSACPAPGTDHGRNRLRRRRVFNGEVVNALRIPDEVIDAVSAEELVELQRRENAYRPGLHRSKSKVKPSLWLMMASQRDNHARGCFSASPVQCRSIVVAAPVVRRLPVARSNATPMGWWR